MPRVLRQYSHQKAIAAIDLGSNALRAVIAHYQAGQLKILKNLRSPLRLGDDVFEKGIIGHEKLERAEEAFIEFLHVFADYGVEDVRSLATSALRDSRNGQALIKRIHKVTGIELKAITGTDEAQLIFEAVQAELKIKNKTAVLMDIGGGSTEITIVKNGKLIASHSFNIGTVRLLKLKSQSELENRINSMARKMGLFVARYADPRKIDCLVGTGGNLRRIGKIRKKILRRSSEECFYQEVAHMADTLVSMTYIERIKRLELDQDRADVILPATMLVKRVMEELEQKRILLPKVGLKEGILLSMLDKTPKRIVFNENN